MIEKISVTDLARLDCKNEYRISNTVFKQLYLFYKSIGESCDKLYSIETDEDDEALSYIDYRFVDLYNKYGFIIDDAGIPSKVLRPYIVCREVVNDIDNYIKQIDEIMKDYNGAFVVIEATPEEQAEIYLNTDCQEYKNALENFYKTCTIANPMDMSYMYDIRSQLSSDSFYKKYVLVDFVDLLVETNCLKTGDTGYTVSCLNKLINNICTYDRNKTVFYFNSNNRKLKQYILSTQQVYSRFYLPLAVIMSIQYGYLFHVTDDKINTVHEYYNNIMGNRSNHCCDYLRNLMNPIKIGCMVSHASYMLCTLAKENYNLVVDLVEMDELIDSDDQSQILSYRKNMSISDIDIVDITDYFMINSKDSSVVFDELYRLNKLSTIFTEVLQKNGSNVISDCSNSLILSVDGKHYFAFVRSINFKYLYNIRCIDSDIKRTVELDSDTVTSVMDLRLFTDYRERFPKYIPIIDSKKFGRSYKGVLYRVASNNGCDYCDVDIVPLDNVFLYSYITQEFRGESVFKYTDDIPSIGLKRKFLSFYGGPVPVTGTDKYSIELSYDMFKEVHYGI